MAGRGRYQQQDENVPIKEMEPLRKIFLGGLKESTTDDMLKEHFSQFGELSDHVVIKDSETGASRKFGFVTFIELEAAHNCLEQKKHNLDGKEVEAKRACKKEVVDKIRDVKKAGDKLKIFVGGLKKETTEESLKSVFDDHEELRLKTESVSIAMNKESGESRGFAFVSFEDEDHVAQVATVVHFTVDDKQVDCRIADPKGQGRGGPGRGGGRGGGGGYGGDRYGGGGGYNDGYGGGGYGGGGGGYDNYSSGGYGGGGYGGGGYGGGGGYDGGYGNGYGNGYGGGDYSRGGNRSGGGGGGRRGGGYNPRGRGGGPRRQHDDY